MYGILLIRITDVYACQYVGVVRGINFHGRLRHGIKFYTKPTKMLSVACGNFVRRCKHQRCRALAQVVVVRAMAIWMENIHKAVLKR